jgi:endonuclease III-like uncharacterized protein
MSATPANINKNRIRLARFAVRRPASTEKSRSLLHLYNQLLEHFGPRHWWPADHPWEMMLGAILVQNTAWTNVEKAIASLKSAKALSVKKIAAMPRRRLERFIRSSGFYRQKAERLQQFAQYLLANPGFFQQLQGLQKAPSLSALRQELLRRQYPPVCRSASCLCGRCLHAKYRPTTRLVSF